MTRTLTVLALVFACDLARADDKSVCLASYSNAQDFRASNKLVDSSRELRVCARAACPAFIARDCSRWLDEVEGATPTIVLAARLDGRDVADVAVFVDGLAFADHLDGAAAPIDPGAHDIEFRRVGLEPLRQQVVVRTGEKNRAMEASFTTPQPEASMRPATRAVVLPPPPVMRDVVVASPWRTVGIIVAGTGAALLVASGVAGVAAVTTKSDHCVGTMCDPGTVGTLRDQTTFATVTFISGVALAAIGVTVAALAKPRHSRISASLDHLTVRF